MFFHLRELEIRAGRFDVELGPGEIEFLDPKLRQVSPLRAVGTAELVTGLLDEIRVKGHIHVSLETECDRCLEPAPLTIDSDFELYYRPVSYGLGDEKEIDPGEAEMGFFEGDGLELNDVLREYVHLALPMQRLCRSDCRGICPVCGQNRNTMECRCERVAVDDRWAGLKSLNNTVKELK